MDYFIVAIIFLIVAVKFGGTFITLIRNYYERK